MRLAGPLVAMTSDAGPAPDADAVTLPAAIIAHESVALALPAAPPAITRADMASLALALMLHAAALIAIVVPASRIGGGGNDFEALGIDIVMAAPALDSRGGDAERARASAAHAVSAAAGAAASEQQDAAADSRQAKPAEENKAEDAPPPADIVVPQWTEPPQPPAAAAEEPVIAPRKDVGEKPEAVASLRPSIDEPRADRSANSAPADAATAARDGGAAARGRDDDGMSEALAAARSGRRDKYGLSVYAALRATMVQPVANTFGKVTIEWTIRSDGTVEDARVKMSSGLPRLDEAALAAVRQARFPPPPPELSGRDLLYSNEFVFR